MTKPKVGEMVKVRHNDDFTYTLDVEVTAICTPDEFIGRIDRVFSSGGEITGGDILILRGQEKKFRNDDILSAAQ
jgi:hypothetical protein